MTFQRKDNLKTQVKKQIELIENGKPLEAFKKFFSDKVIMNNNKAVFANNKKEGFELQIAFMNNVSDFKAIVYYSNINKEISTLGIDYSFKNAVNEFVNFKGIHKQKWKDGLIIEEDFYTGDYLNRTEFKVINNF